MRLWQTVKTHIKCCGHTAAFHMGIHCLLRHKRFSEKEIQILFRNNMWPLDRYNEPSQYYCIKPEGRTHYICRYLKSFWGVTAFEIVIDLYTGKYIEVTTDL